ncbi:hypothetical protein B0T26DRAFT_708353 [Lasiosphaeria miniovina]|uniref:Uncharacterized protein n=1 Tax=Lasiosphaeria miniovina TaxID=1954250 RepID=A0AA40AJL1_9PEZI|nr:uncharacterized protein B0T26DRAFT_708353 [Lasiosphaeria miniovina]KAK0717071.1 hypothetical protein B0T26DRAFT_708353 [Lasiosphaeria miniovina]
MLEGPVFDFAKANGMPPGPSALPIAQALTSGRVSASHKNKCPSGSTQAWTSSPPASSTRPHRQIRKANAARVAVLCPSCPANKSLPGSFGLNPLPSGLYYRPSCTASSCSRLNSAECD